MNMNIKQWLAVTVVAVLGTGAATAQISSSTNLSFSVNEAIPVADANGLALAQTLTLPTLQGPVTDVTVTLDISGGYNGDLYAYLAGGNGGFAVLLNRTGVNGGNAFGYGDSGFNVTFDDSASYANIHTYQNEVNPGGGVLTGTWGSDGEAIDPQSAPSDFPTTPTALLSSFDGNPASGTYTLFLANLSAGSPSTIVSWGLDITAVPEPAAIALGALGGLALLALKFSRQRRD